MSKLKLNLDEIKVESFETIEQNFSKGTIIGNAPYTVTCTCNYTQEEYPPCQPTGIYYDTCNNNPTCIEYGSCFMPTCVRENDTCVPICDF